METHQLYEATYGEGATCSECEDTIPIEDEAVLLQPVTIQGDGSAKRAAKAFHGILCLPCYREL